jgi:hypothetical protein
MKALEKMAILNISIITKQYKKTARSFGKYIDPIPKLPCQQKLKGR